MQLSLKSLISLCFLVLFLSTIGTAEPLRADISYPQSGDNLSGTIAIRGSAGGTGFTSYSLRLERKSSYRHLTESSQIAEDELLYQLETAAIESGSYLLVLDVRGANNNGRTDEVPIFIDNEPPQILGFSVDKALVKRGVKNLHFNFSLLEQGSGIKKMRIKACFSRVLKQ